MVKFTKVKTMDNFVTERVDVHQNALLGDYDKEGNYYISPEIVKELLLMKKVKKSTYNNSMFCVSNNLGIGELVFEIHYDKKVRNGLASCEIFLLENVYKVNGYYSNTLRTSIGKFEESVDGFIEKSYVNFNITLQDDDDGREEKVDFKNLPYPFILAKKQYEHAMFKNIEGNIYSAYEDYFAEKMDKLKKQCTPFSESVVVEYSNDLKAIEGKFVADGKDDAKAKSELLDKAIDTKIDDPATSKEDVDKYKDDIKDITQKLENKYDSAVDYSSNKIKKQMLRSEYEKVGLLHKDLDDHNMKLTGDGVKGKSFVTEEVQTKDISDSGKDKQDKEFKSKPKITPKKDLYIDREQSKQPKTSELDNENKSKDIVDRLKADILRDKKMANQSSKQKQKELEDQVEELEGVVEELSSNKVDKQPTTDSEYEYPAIDKGLSDLITETFIDGVSKVVGGDIDNIIQSTPVQAINKISKLSKTEQKNNQSIDKLSSLMEGVNSFAELAVDMQAFMENTDDRTM